MALTAGEYISGGEVRDADGRTVVLVEGGAGGGATFAQGTAAARPGTPVTNFYFATDTGEISVANAGLTAWQAIASTSATTWKVATAAGGGAAYTQMGDSINGDAAFFFRGSNSFLETTAKGIQLSSGSLGVAGVGGGLIVAEGANAKQGVATLAAGSVVVANTSVTATSRIFLTSNADGGTPGFLRVSARTAGTSFTITSSSGTDTSTVAYQIFEAG